MQIGNGNVDLHGSIEREITAGIPNDLNIFPATVLLGPRQAGNSTLAKSIGRGIPDSVCLDLESSGDLAKLSDLELLLGLHSSLLVILDEIQTLPALFRRFAASSTMLFFFVECLVIY